MKNKKKILIIVGLVIIIIGILSIFRLFVKKDVKERDLAKVSYNHRVDDEIIMMLYDRYQVEDDFKFQLVGSDMNEDLFGFYFRESVVSFQDFSSIYKSYVLLDLINYTGEDYDEERECYLYSLQEFKDLYQKYYGNLDHFDIDTEDRYSPRFYLDDSNICITKENNQNKNYQKVIDTYMVNGVYQGDKIIIYERVAFIRITDRTIDFYSDIDMKKLVYSIKKDGIDMGFVHNSKLVSNVLVQYQDKFPIYEYQYVRGDTTYYLDRIHS